MIIKHSKLFKIYCLIFWTCEWDGIVEGSHEDSGGGTKYVKKRLERKWKIPSKKMGCPCNIVIKHYPDMERILGHYKRDYDHLIGIANVPFTCLSARSWR